MGRNEKKDLGFFDGFYGGAFKDLAAVLFKDLPEKAGVYVYEEHRAFILELQVMCTKCNEWHCSCRRFFDAEVKEFLKVAPQIDVGFAYALKEAMSERLKDHEICEIELPFWQMKKILSDLLGIVNDTRRPGRIDRLRYAITAQTDRLKRLAKDKLVKRDGEIAILGKIKEGTAFIGELERVINPWKHDDRERACPSCGAQITHYRTYFDDEGDETRGREYLCANGHQGTRE